MSGSRTHFRRFLPGLVLAACGAWASPPVEVTDPVIPFLRRLEEKGVIGPEFLGTLPRSRADVLGALREAEAAAHRLGPWDLRRLERHLDAFDPGRRSAATRFRHRDSLLEATGRVRYHTLGATRDSLPRAEGYAFGTLAVGVDGTYREMLHFTADAFIGSERNRNGRFLENYDPQRGMPYNTSREGKSQIAIPQGVSTFDGFRTMVGFGDGRLVLEAGQDWNQWGPGRWQQATLGPTPHFWVSDSLAPDANTGFSGTGQTYWAARRGYRVPGEGPPLPQVRIRFGGDRWEYVKLVAERTGMWSDSSAWLVAHRATLRLGAWKFGVTEMMAFGGKAPGMLLLLPGIPLKFAEHEEGDRANVALSGDLEWTITGHGRVYGELFVDDYSGPPLSFRGNKFGITLGGVWQDPLGLPAQLQAEYSSVDPWTYGHHRQDAALQHYGALLGSQLPPNARAVTLAADFPLPAAVEGGIEYRFRQRDLKSRGSSIFDSFGFAPDGTPVPDEPTDKDFLERDVETRHAVQFSARREWRYLTVEGAAGYLGVRNWRGYAGRDLATPTASAGFTLRY